MNKIYFPALFLAVSLLFSCKKDVDEKGPEVIFNSPVENQSFNVYDYVTVNATVTDEVRLNSVSVSLVDASQGYAHVAVPVSVTGNSMTFNLAYELDNIHLETGVYYIRISATDGKNTTQKYRKIYLVAIPKALKAIYVLSNTGSSQTNLQKLDTNFTAITPYNTFSGDYLASSVSNYHQQAYICGNYTGDLRGHVLEFNYPKFTVPAIVSGTPHFTGYHSDDQNAYVARFDGTIKGYNYVGGVMFNAAAYSGYYARKMCFNSGYLIADEKEQFSSIKRLVTYLPTGAVEKNCTLNQDVVAFCEMDAENVFVFGNVSGQATIQLFDRIDNNLWNPYPFTLAPGALLSALKLDSDTYLLGHSNGTIYKYQYSLSGVTTFLPGYTAVQLKYDALHDELYVVEANKVTTFHLTSMSMVHTINSTQNILDLHLLYNR